MIEDLNYFNDPRTQGPAAEKHILYYYNEATGENKKIELPTHWEVCDVCHGAGSHVNPNIDCGGISEEMHDDPDFRENYMSGVYDVTCYTCGGKRVVKGVDWDALSGSSDLETVVSALKELEQAYSSRMATYPVNYTDLSDLKRRVLALESS